MKIAFFTEMDFTGKIPRTHENMRTEFAWMVALNADHYNINSLPSKPYDLGIVIIPKKNPNFDLQKLKTICSKVAVMQEGPHWYFQDYPLEKQIWYYNTLIESDIIFTHNESDKIYYQGLTEHKDVRVMKSLMIEDAVGKLDDVKRKGVIIGGNFVNWYGGFDSFMIAQEIENIIYAPSMGRKQPGEEQFVNHLPYMNWKQWIHKLNEFEIGVHLMRTHAAGTFSLNCAYLGIPCIGYEGLDTQEKCHPDLTVKLGDLKKAKELIKKLRDDKEFYLSCSNKSKNNYKQYFKEEIYKVEWEKIIKTVK
jgi:hypothetical protein